MVETNKILTVSYGTFSCTLEGFDDSFGTMKAIAEYFRDLAADDRYFGAEPPTPDAEMLARIAEKEIARRVEARMEENKIVLRADQGNVVPVALPEARSAEAPVPVAEPLTPEVSAPAEPQAEPPLAAPDHIEPVDDTDEDIGEDVAAEPAPQDDISVETDAEDMDEIDDEEIDDDPMAIIEASSDDTDYNAALRAKAAAEDVAPEAELPQAPEADPAPDTDTDTDTDIAEVADAGPATEATEDEADAALAEDDSDSVVAKLRRIRAVVSGGNVATADPAYSEDEHAVDFLADTHEDIEAALAIDDAAEDPDNAPVETDDSDISGLLDRFGDEDDAQPVEQELEDDEDELFAPEAFEEETGDDLVDEGPEDDVLDEEVLEDDGFAEDELHDDEDGRTEPASDAAPIRARVIKMKRRDFEAAIASGELEEDDDAPEDDSSLSDEDEAELMRELAAVEAELEDDDSAEAAEATLDEGEDEDDEDLATELQDAFDDEKDEDENGAFADVLADLADAENEERANDDAEDDEAEVAEADDNIFGGDGEQPEEDQASPFRLDTESEMGRIFDKTDSQMDEETGKGRRNAIAHLRAAVAAAKAEEGAGGKLSGEGPDTEAYRDDLANVVRPRRPEAGKSQTRRPDTPRPAPLKLVAEQRIDLDEAKSATPVRPRRVAMAPAAIAAEAVEESNFADYAESVGADSLPELLEAAAAYLSFVEGREQFSRPQLMTQLRQVEMDEFSREDGLRFFGQLLRDGKIEKISGGRFKASENISYRPDARYAGE